MRLKVKEGTHNTQVNVRFSEGVTVPMCVITAIEPLGNFTCDETTTVMEVKSDEQLIIWSVALVSIIQESFFYFCFGTILIKEVEKIKYLGSTN